jgi:hypothetical protein
VAYIVIFHAITYEYDGLISVSLAWPWITAA